LRTSILRLKNTLAKTKDAKKQAELKNKIIRLELTTKGFSYVRELKNAYKKNNKNAALKAKYQKALRIWYKDSGLRRKSRGCFRRIVTRRPVTAVKRSAKRRYRRRIANLKKNLAKAPKGKRWAIRKQIYEYEIYIGGWRWVREWTRRYQTYIIRWRKTIKKQPAQKAALEKKIRVWRKRIYWVNRLYNSRRVRRGRSRVTRRVVRRRPVRRVIRRRVVSRYQSKIIQLRKQLKITKAAAQRTVIRRQIIRYELLAYGVRYYNRYRNAFFKARRLYNSNKTNKVYQRKYRSAERSWTICR
jgi:hypothetical protein